MVPAAVLNVHGVYADVVAGGILDELRRGVEAHGQAVEQPAVKGCRLVAFEPGGYVHQQGEAGGMGFRKAIFAKALNLAKHPLGEIPVVAARQHAIDELLLETAQAAAALPGGHGASQLIGLAGGEAGGHHGQFDHLLLKDGHPKGALEHPAHPVIGILHRLQTLPAAQVGMHHVPLDGSGPDDGDLDDQIVKMPRLEPRQHGHLRPGFHLKHADAVAALQHRVGFRVFRRDGRHGEPGAAMGIDGGDRLADGGEHAEPQHVDLHQPQRLEIVFVPLDDGTVLHGGILRRHELGQGAPGYDKAANVLRQMPGEAENAVDEIQELLHHRAVGVEPSGLKALPQGGSVVPPGERLGEQIQQVEIHAQRLADVAHGTLRSIGDEGRGQRRAVPAVTFVDVLDDLLAALVLEIHVDVRRLVALLVDEALEQQVHARRIHLGDVQAITHRGVGRRAPPLTEDVLAAGELHDVLHGEEVILVVELADEYQLTLHQGPRLFRHALGPALGGAGVGELAQVRLRREVRRHQLFRVFIAQLVQREAAALGDEARLQQHLRRIQGLQRGNRPQVPLRVLIAAPAELGHRGSVADGGEHVLQRLPLGGVSMHVVGRGDGQIEPHGEGEGVGHLVQIVVFAKQLEGDPQLGKQGLQLPALIHQRADIAAAGNPQGKTLRDRPAEIAEMGLVAAFGRAPPQPGDQRRQLAVSAAIRRQQHQPEAFHQPELRPDDEPDVELPGGHVRLHQPGKRALVGKRDGLVAQFRGANHQLLGVRSTAQKAVVTQTVELSERHDSPRSPEWERSPMCV